MSNAGVVAATSEVVVAAASSSTADKRYVPHIRRTTRTALCVWMSAIDSHDTYTHVLIIRGSNLTIVRALSGTR
jgi:hypothetical protein